MEKESDFGKEQNQFRIEFRNPEVTYALLTRGVKEQKLFLDDNWNSDIYSSKYDLVKDVYTVAVSHLWFQQHPESNDRNMKALELRQFYTLADSKFDSYYWSNNIDKLKDEIAEEGLSANIFEVGFADSDNPDAKLVIDSKSILINRGNYSVVISFLKPNGDDTRGNILLDLYEIKNGVAEHPKLEDYSLFSEAADLFMEVSQETIRVMYKIAGKQLPNEKLTFWAEKTKEKGLEYIAMKCGACGGGYPADQIAATESGILVGNPTCPRCGATTPQVMNLSTK